MSSPTVQTFQPSKRFRRNHHREIGFAAGAGKRRGNIGLFARGIFHAEDQHVLGHPAFIARDVGGDAQSKTFLAEQRVAAVAGAVRPDLARLGKMNDVFFRVAGPRHVFLAGRKRRAHRVHARNHARIALINFLKYRQADARHDAHVHDDVRRIGKLHADLRHRRADRAHAERQHVHRAALHRAAEEAFSFLRISKGSSQLLVGPALSFESEQMKVRSSTRATSPAIGAGVVAAGPELLVEFDERAGLDHLGAEHVVFFLRAIHPVDGGGLGKLGHFLHPAEQVVVVAQGDGCVLNAHRFSKLSNSTSPRRRSAGWRRAILTFAWGCYRNRRPNRSAGL